MGRKRKSISPEPPHAKVAKWVPQDYANEKMNYSLEKQIYSSSKRKVSNTSSPIRLSARFNCQETDNAVSGLNMVQSSCIQSEMETELGLVISLDEEGTRETEQLRTKSGEKLIKGLLTNDDKEFEDKCRDAEGSDLDENSEDEFRKLDRDLAVKSKQHNLSSIHVRSIIHEVITNEHVVAMMKAAIRETQDMPMFEPKMTRSKLKEVVEKGVGIPNWNISPIKQSKEIKPPQFVDIPFEDEDSSDEEYYPDEDEEDTAEETILESDMESISSSPRTSKQACSCTPVELTECDDEKSVSPRMGRHLTVEAVPMGPPVPPFQSSVPSRPSRALDSFLEKLHAVDEELELNPLCIEPYQALSGGENAEESLVACRTRSKRPLRDVPLDQLEAKLNAPDITPDMYDFATYQEDKEWSQWLQGLMTSHLDNEEGDDDDDDDDPEYNFLDDPDKPDLEDYRNDRAVRITKKEVNELMDELFESFQDDFRVAKDEVHEKHTEQKKVSSESAAKFNVPQTMRFEEPLAHMLTMCRRVVREQLDALQQHCEHQNEPRHNARGPAMLLIPPTCTLMVTSNQKCQLRQQIQQHVQLLTQVNMLCSPVGPLQSQATTTKLFLTELQSFAERAEQMRAVVDSGFKSVFRVCNLQPSLDLLKELEKTALPPIRQAKVHRYPLLPSHLGWLFATRSLFLYPELLPHCSLDPSLQPPRNKHIYTKGEDGLIVLGLKHFRETEFPYHLMSQYLIQPKRVEHLRARVKDMCSSRATNNIIKFYCQNHTVPQLPVACCPVVAGEERPPVERDKNIMPNWLLKSLPCIHKEVFQRRSEERASPNKRTVSPPLFTFPEGTQYAPSLPKGLTLQLHPSTKRQSSARAYKPRPLHGFACPSSKPLAKAPVYPSNTINILSPVTPPLPSQSVVLLTRSPFISMNETLPVTGVTKTPANRTVSLNSCGPVNFQCIVPPQGCENHMEPPSNLPLASVPLSSAVAYNIPVPTNEVGKRLNILQPKVQGPRRKILPRNLIPIQPSFSSTHLAPLTNISVTLNSNVTSTISNNFIDNSSSLLIVRSPIDSQGLAKSSKISSSQDSFIQHFRDIPYTGTLSRPLLARMPSPDCNKEPDAGACKPKSNPVFSSHAASPPLQIAKTLRTTLQSVGDEEKSWSCVKGVFAHDILVSNCQSNPLPDDKNNSIPANLNCNLLVPRNKSSRDESPTTIPQSTIISPKPKNSHNFLLQAASQTDTKQTVIIPINSLIQNQPQLHFVKGEDKATTHHSFMTFSTAEMLNVDIRKGNRSSVLTVGLPLGGALSHGPVLQSTNVGDVEEDMDTDVEVGVEDMTSALFTGSPLILSESSCSSGSNLSNISHVDSSTGTLEKKDNISNTGEQHFSLFNKESGNCMNYASANPNKSEGPELLTFTSGNENQEHCGGGEGLNNGNGGHKGEGHENKGNGEGAESNANGEGERNGDGRGERPGDEGRDKNGDDKDADGEREEEEEDFDELTQDEDEEEVMSSASEESVLSVPELQETMEKLTWLASERRLCGDGDSEEDNSPNSPTSPISQNSQEENSDDEEEGAIKGDELEPTEGEKMPEGDAPLEDDPPQISGKGARRGRGRARPPPRSLGKSKRQERGSKDTSKLLLLCDNHILDNDPMRESKDIAYAQAYLNRVREALQDTPDKVEEFLSLLFEFEQGSTSHSVVELFCQLKPLLKDCPELLRDFAAFLLPEQALECGLVEEQQAFERSRRFLRQLEISFGENPSHYQKIVKALQAASSFTPAGVEELKTQISTLLKGHTHLQGEFSAFFDELRPSPACPGQFEEAVWFEDAGNMTEESGRINPRSAGFEEVTLPDLEEEEETLKMSQITGKSRKRKEMSKHRNYKDCDWPKKHCPCHCHFTGHDAKHRRHKRKGCPRCHGIKSAHGPKSMKTDHSFPMPELPPEKQNERDESDRVEEEKEKETEIEDVSCLGANGPHNESEDQSWESIEADPLSNPDEKNYGEGEKEWKEGSMEQCLSLKTREVPGAEHMTIIAQSGERDVARQSPSFETPVCAKNISLTPSGEKVVLWTREADRVILTACQQQGASQSTFQSVSSQLGNKTANEVSKRFRDLMRLFHTSARQASSDEETTEQQSATDEEQD